MFVIVLVVLLPIFIRVRVHLLHQQQQCPVKAVAVAERLGRQGASSGTHACISSLGIARMGWHVLTIMALMLNWRSWRCVCVCVCACVRACVCVHVRVHVRSCVTLFLLLPLCTQYGDIGSVSLPPKLKVFSAASADRSDINSGDKIILSPQILVACEQQDLSYPIVRTV